MPDFSKADIKEICRETIAEERENTNWYSNKDLFDMISSIKTGQQSLTSQIKNLVESIKDQNNRHNNLEGELRVLREKVVNLEDKVANKEIESEAKQGFVAKIKANASWILAFVLSVLLLIERISGLIRG